MNKWLTVIIFQIISLFVLGATEMPNTDTSSPMPEDSNNPITRMIDQDIPQDLLPPCAPIETGSYRNLILIILLILITGLVALILLLFYRKRQILEAPPLSSFQQFISDLNRAKLHVYTPDTKEFCSTLCFALKSYLQREYQLPITCRTTEEFLKLFSKSSKFRWETISMLTDILQYSDQAKFAGQALHPDLHKDLFSKTCYFVREVKQIRRQAKIKAKVPEK